MDALILFVNDNWAVVKSPNSEKQFKFLSLNPIREVPTSLVNLTPVNLS